MVKISEKDLRALLFWANVGVGQSFDGSYGNIILKVIDAYAEHLKFQLKRNQFKEIKRA